MTAQQIAGVKKVRRKRSAAEMLRILKAMKALVGEYDRAQKQMTKTD